MKAQGAVEIAAGLIDVTMFEFKLAGNELSRGAQLRVAFAFKFRKSVGVNLAIFNDCPGKITLVRESVHRRERRKINGTLAAGGSVRRQAAGFDVIY